MPGRVVEHTGPADVFLSHTWGASWGTLVVAALDGAAPGRLVWVDNLAVRQFPGNAADLVHTCGRCDLCFGGRQSARIFRIDGRWTALKSLLPSEFSAGRISAG